MATCCNSACVDIYKAALSDIPSKWATQIASLLCQLDSDKYSGISCDKVQECETLTAITDFSLNGNVMSISYRDENETVNVKNLTIALGNFINNQFTGNQSAEFWISGRGRLANLDVTGASVPQNGLFLSAANTLGISTNGGLVTSIDDDALMTHTGDIFLSAGIGDEPAISFFLNTLAGSDYFIQRRGTTLDFHAAGIGMMSGSADTEFTVNGNANRGFEMASGGLNLLQMFPDGSLIVMTTNVQQTPDASAILELNSTTRGFLPSRMTTAEKNAIASPTEGLIIYDIDLRKICVYTSGWETVTSS